MYRRVAIIGGGAAAATLLSELLDRHSPQPLHLDWYTGGAPMARGVAYGTCSARHLLNVRAASMSMFSGKPGGFLDYARQRDANVAGHDFLPRQLYGDYLEAEVEHSLERASVLGHDVHVLPFAVDAIVPERDGVTVVHGEDSTHVDAAVLALGALPPQPLPGVAASALDSGHYITDPWPFLVHAEDDARPLKVVVIGLGLTAVDVLLELSARWPQAEFTTVSRHALLPEPHLATASAPANDGGAMIETMLDAPAVHGWLKLLREAIDQDDGDWRTVIDSLRPHTSALWHSLPDEERARFLRHARWAWERARHRMPPQVHAAISALEQNGRLQRLRGRMEIAEADGPQLRLRAHATGSDSRFDIRADYVIQTIGLNLDIRRTAHPLVRQLVTNGHARSDALGQGFAATPDGRLQPAEGEPWQRLLAIGSLMRSALWETTAMPEIRQQARSLAERILAD